MGDNGKYQVVGCGIVTFQRDLGKSFQLYEVLYVSSLSKNLVFVSTLEDYEYVVTFMDKKVCIRPKRSKVIGVTKGTLYGL